MDVTLQTIGSFAVAAFAWIILEFIGRPLRRFFDLRGEVLRQLTMFANVFPLYKDIPDDSGAISGNMEVLDVPQAEIDRTHEAERIFRDLASQMRAFAGNETLALSACRMIGYDPFSAGSGLIGLSNSIDKDRPERAFHKKTIAIALKVGPEFS
jgi:hypothetical protein